MQSNFRSTGTIAMTLAAGWLCCVLSLWGFQPNPATAQTGRAAESAGKLEPKEQTASLEGCVVNAVTGDPLRKATLMLTRSGGSATPATAETDDQGHFAFQNLEAGRYILFGERTGFARQAYGARGNSLSGTALLFSAGQEMKDLLFKLSPNSVIAGKVLDEDGEPLANTTVMALRTAYQRGKRQFMPIGAAQTNDLGEFRIASLKAGRYIISATHRNLAGIMGGSGNKPPADKPESSYTTTFFPNSIDAESASPVEVGLGVESRGSDIRMVKVNTFRVKGKLSEPPQGKTVIVFLSPKGAGMIALITRSFALAQQTDGSFEIKGVAPGAYLLSSSGQDGMPSGVMQPVQVTDQHVEGIVLQLGGGGDLPGVVTVEGKDPVDLKSIQVVLESTDMMLVRPKVPVGEDGKFTLKGVAPGRYLVRVSGGPETLYLKSVRFGPQEVGEDGIDLSNGVSGSLEITLSQAGAQLDGTVRGEDSNPRSGVTVVLIPDSKRYSLYKEMTTDQRGGFSLKGITPGDYKVLAWEDIEPGAYQDPEFLKQFEGEAKTISLKESDRQALTLKAIPAEKGAKGVGQ